MELICSCDSEYHRLEPRGGLNFYLPRRDDFRYYWLELGCAPGVPRHSGFAATAKRDAREPVLKCGILTRDELIFVLTPYFFCADA
jgi:hypothetical protein